MRRRAFLALFALFLAAPTVLQAQEETVVVYLVRHAERAEDGSNDPPISEAGWERSRLVGTMLADAGLTRIHSTDFKRTRSTGQPTAEGAGIEIESYDSRDLPGFAAQLKTMPGRHLVLGHSNTTPQLVEALGGDPGGDIEEMEYDRFYIVTIIGGQVSNVMLRFGELYEG